MSCNAGSVRFVCVHGSPMQSHKNKKALHKTKHLLGQKFFKMDNIACHVWLGHGEHSLSISYPSLHNIVSNVQW